MSDDNKPGTGPAGLPREIGGYRVQRELGRGGMATVYAALQDRPRRTVAIKVLKRDVDSETALRRFRREIEILGKLRHPFVAQVFEAGTWDDGVGLRPFLVMEYVPRAKTILEFTAARQLALRERIKLFIQVCAAVEHGHRHKIIHRDLKPGNILIDEEGRPKVIDFGVARPAEIDEQERTLDADANRLVGTIQYMSPEQLSAGAHDLDARCDVYALGVVLYKLLTGHMPHELTGLPVYAAIHVIREDEPPRPSSRQPDVRSDLDAIVLKALSKKPAQRYRDAGHLGRDLVRYLDGRPVHARPAGPARRLWMLARRRRVAAVAAIAVVLTVVVAGGLVGWLLREKGREADRFTEALARERESAEAARASIKERTTAVREAAVPRESFRLAGDDGLVSALAFHPTGEWLAAGTVEHALVIWNLLPPREPAWTSRDHEQPVDHVAWSGDGFRLVSVSSDDGYVIVRDATDGGFVDETQMTDARIGSLAFDTQGSLVALGCDDLTLRLWEVDGPERQRLRGTTGRLRSVAFSSDGQLVVAGSERDVAYVWDTTTGTLKEQLRGLPGSIVAVAFVANDTRVVAVADDGAAALWTLGTPWAPESFDAMPDIVTVASVDASGTHLLAFGDDHLRVWSLDERPSEQWNLYADFPSSVMTIGPDGAWCAVADAAGGVHVEPVVAGQARDERQ